MTSNTDGLSDARALPDVLPGHWTGAAGRDMAVQTLADRDMAHNRARISDFALANEVFLSPGIANLTDAKERIRWLSAQLALALATPSASTYTAIAADIATTITSKADQCDRLAEVSRAPACFEYRAKAQAYREVLTMLAATPKAASEDGASQRRGEWDQRYRPLKHGEIIKAADECRRDDGSWITGICVGGAAPDPAYTSHRVYRRLIAASAVDRLAEIHGEGSDDDQRYLIRKGGSYYRKNSQGYTHHREAAGRYTLAEAIAITHPNGPDGPRDGMYYIADELPVAGRTS